MQSRYFVLAILIVGALVGVSQAIVDPHPFLTKLGNAQQFRSPWVHMDPPSFPQHGWQQRRDAFNAWNYGQNQRYGIY